MDSSWVGLCGGVSVDKDHKSSLCFKKIVVFVSLATQFLGELTCQIFVFPHEIGEIYSMNDWIVQTYIAHGEVKSSLNIKDFLVKSPKTRSI